MFVCRTQVIKHKFLPQYFLSYCLRHISCVISVAALVTCATCGELSGDCEQPHTPRRLTPAMGFSVLYRVNPMFIDMWYQLTDYPWESSSRYPNEYTAYEWVDPNDPDEGYAFYMGVLHGPQPA